MTLPSASRATEQIELVAPAKLTLSLRITGVREDGFHLIDAEMVSLDLCDRLFVDPGGSGLTVERNGTTEAGDPDDLILRALALAGRRAGVRVHKRIPAGAGLGGGSSDAAAILRWAGFADLGAAAALGADIAFCMVGGRARVRGIGELVEPLPSQPTSYTLLTPPLHCSTPVVYRSWDGLGGPRGAHGNDLEPAAIAAYPELLRWRDEFEARTGRRPRLAGSGSTWFVEGELEGDGHVVTRTLPPH